MNALIADIRETIIDDLGSTYTYVEESMEDILDHNIIDEYWLKIQREDYMGCIHVESLGEDETDPSHLRVHVGFYDNVAPGFISGEDYNAYNYGELLPLVVTRVKDATIQ